MNTSEMEDGNFHLDWVKGVTNFKDHVILVRKAYKVLNFVVAGCWWLLVGLGNVDSIIAKL